MLCDWGHRTFELWPCVTVLNGFRRFDRTSENSHPTNSAACQENGKHNDAVTDSNNNNNKIIHLTSAFDFNSLQIENISKRTFQLTFDVQTTLNTTPKCSTALHILTSRCPAVRSSGMWRSVACYISVALYLHLQDQAGHTDYHARRNVFLELATVFYVEDCFTKSSFFAI